MVYYSWKSYKLSLEAFQAFSALAHSRYCFFLDSSLGAKNGFGRYSFLGIEPFFVLRSQGRDPFPILRDLLEKYQLKLPHQGIPFLGGAMGYLAYDLGLALESKVRCAGKSRLPIPDYCFGFYNTVVIIDHLKKLLHIFACGLPEKKNYFGKILAQENIKIIRKIFQDAVFEDPPRLARQRNAEPPLCFNFRKEDYLRAIARAKEYIRRGDIYQVNLSQQARTSSRLSAPELYLRLRQASPTHFSAYFDCGDFQILSSSPERFLKLEGPKVITQPRKGTRARGMSPALDRKFKKELLDSPKDKAELLMIVDLERNDLGKVCSYDSIRVKNLRQLEEYATVFQTTATVEGKLHKDKDRIDLLRACFPGGSITGCPKIRAMEIIEELEPKRRGIYTGCLGYLSFSGDMDFNILIRTILKRGATVSFGVGGGIVTDSVPEKEYHETLIKAKAMSEAIDSL
jgi:para-aminobenzoate synthetase component I